jgi:two-component system sensor histidine kinase UhpB
MKQHLKILHLEDMPADAEMVERELKKANIQFDKVLVSNKADFIQCLKEFSPDIILSDHSLPSFDSHEALSLVKQLGIKAPFILVTATVSEEYAVNIIKEGAYDYILKDRLQRLPNAVISAIYHYQLEEEKKKAIEILRSSERKYKLIFESNPMPMWMISRSAPGIIDVNDAATIHYGYSREQFLSINPTLLSAEDDIATVCSPGIFRHRKSDGCLIMADITTHDVVYEGQEVVLVLANDVTIKVHAEAELTRYRAQQQKLITETSIQVQEKEREEIGKELHDNINQILASTKLYLEHAISEMNGSCSELLKRSHKNVSQAIEEIRQLSHKLVAPSLGAISLLRAVEELIENIKMVSSVKIELHSDNFHEEAIDKNMKLMFYRIIQEQVNNILKHSGATGAIIELSATNLYSLLAIEDNGVGFDSSSASAGIGLRNIRNRAGYYNGTVNVIAAPQKGCRLEVIIPLQH